MFSDVSELAWAAVDMLVLIRLAASATGVDLVETLTAPSAIIVPAVSNLSLELSDKIVGDDVSVFTDIL